MELIIRRFQPEDQPAVWELHNKALIAAGAHIGNGKWDDDLNDIEGIYIRPGGEFLVGTIDSRIVAMGALKKMSDFRAEVKRMRVEPDLQRQGYGQAMLTRLENRARELGFVALQLDTMVVQVAAQKLYENNNYQVFGRRAILGSHMCIYYEKNLI